jgi:hypothetical protein
MNENLYKARGLPVQAPGAANKKIIGREARALGGTKGQDRRPTISRKPSAVWALVCSVSSRAYFTIPFRELARQIGVIGTHQKKEKYHDIES